MPRSVEVAAAFCVPLQNVFWVTYNCSGINMRMFCAFMRAFRPP